MYTEINETVKMLALFNNGSVIPQKFRWHNRDYVVKEVSLAYQQREGRSVNYYFSIETTDGGVFKICYNDEGLDWKLLEIWNQ